MGPAYPELVVHRQAAPSFEDQLREALRSAPYLVIALLVHALLLLVLAGLKVPLPVPDEEQVIKGEQPEVIDDPLVLVPPQAPSVDEPDPAVADPVVTEPDLADPLADSERDLPLLTAGAELSTGSVLGLGEGPSGGPGGRGGPGGSGRAPPQRTEQAVRAALLWLSHHQAPDGHWSASEFSEQCGALGSDTVCDGRGSPLYDAGVTALALLPFLGAGHTDKHGEFSRTVRAGLRYLVEIQEPDGSIGTAASTTGTYDHVLATLALCEGLLRGRSPNLRRPAQAAVDRLLALRTPGAGWRYLPDHPEMADPARRSDSSVTGWAILALLTAGKAGLVVEAGALEDGLLFLDEMTDPVTGRTGYITRGGSVAREAGAERLWPEEQSEAMTAVAVLCRALADPAQRRPGAGDLQERGAALLAGLPPVWDEAQPGRRDLYFWYYGAYALFQAGDKTQWRTWEQAILEVVLPAQQGAGERKGSWDPQPDPWGHLGGRVYSTALMTLLLEVYYRYPALVADGR